MISKSRAPSSETKKSHLRPFTFLAVFSFIILSLPSHAFTASASGTCREFTVALRGSEAGCWDVKVDMPGETLTEDGWKDSFYYAAGAYCSGSGSVKFIPESFGNVTGTVKIRQNNTMAEAPLTIAQQCEDNKALRLDVVLAVVFILAFGVYLARR